MFLMPTPTNRAITTSLMTTMIGGDLGALGR
jgi:hypothetical protein